MPPCICMERRMALDYPGVALRADMLSKGIDLDASMAVLQAVNTGAYDGAAPIAVSGVPALESCLRIHPGTRIQKHAGESGAGKSGTVIRAGQHITLVSTREYLGDKLQSLGLPVSALPDGALISDSDGYVRLDRKALSSIGELLFGQTAWGVLNGGQATSYADLKKNKALGAPVFDAVRKSFDLLSPLCAGKPKGLTPAYINPDGSPGESFLLLKMRAALLLASNYRRRTAALGQEQSSDRRQFGRLVERSPLPFFQMTSDGTDAELAAAYATWGNHPWLADLIEDSGVDPTRPRSARQPLIAALTHSSEGRPRRFFDRAWGKENASIALPGGHGQSFRVLADVYRNLLADGYRFAWLGNVDNIGYVPDAAELAVFAMSEAGAAFEFSYRTPVDIKGGIVVRTADGSLTVGDIGQAISGDEVEELEARGDKVLFNCATCVLDLSVIVPKLDDLAARLPVRVSDQDKDAGRYSQAEQSTWEVVGLLDSPLGFAVEKGDRFIAAKLLAETILASGRAGVTGPLPADVRQTAAMMSGGLENVLSTRCDLHLSDGQWGV